MRRSKKQIEEEDAPIRLRIAQVRAKMPIISYMGAYELLHGVQSREQRKRIQQVYNNNVIDEQITKNFEILIEEFKKTAAL